MRKIVLVEPKSTHLHVYSRVAIPRLGVVLLGTILRNLGYEVRVYIEDIAPIVERTPALIDMPLGAWAVVVNGEDATIDHEDEAAAFDYDYVGERTIVSATTVTRRRVSELAVVAPEPRVFRVVERRATFCGPPPIRGEPVTLALQLPERWGEPSGGGGWQQYFQWEVRP